MPKHSSSILPELPHSIRSEPVSRPPPQVGLAPVIPSVRSRTPQAAAGAGARSGAGNWPSVGSGLRDLGRLGGKLKRQGWSRYLLLQTRCRVDLHVLSSHQQTGKEHENRRTSCGVNRVRWHFWSIQGPFIHRLRSPPCPESDAVKERVSCKAATARAE